MIKFKIEGNTVECPTKWSEVTVEHFIKPEFLSGNPIHLLSVLSGVSKKKLSSTTEDLTEHFNKTVQFMVNDPKGWQGDDDKPIELELMDIKCIIPVNIEAKSFGQKIMFGQAISKSVFVYDHVPDAIAIYLGEQIFPDDWFDRIDEIKKEVLKLPITKVYRIADFFLTLLKASKRNGQST